jgi:hypothetical protein
MSESTSQQPTDLGSLIGYATATCVSNVTLSSDVLNGKRQAQARPR